MILKNLGKQTVKLKKITKKPKTRVYDIEVDHDNHRFIANGISVHNCQEIYGWRYSRADLLFDVPFWNNYFLHNMVFELPNNYRSTTNIVRVCNTYRSFLDGIDSIPHQPEVKGSVNVTSMTLETHEGRFVAGELAKRITQDGIQPKDFTILVRTNNYIKSVLEPALIENKIPYTIDTPKAKKKLFNSEINRVFFSMMSIFVNNDDLMSVISIADLSNGIGEMSKQSLVQNYLATNTIIDDVKYTPIRRIFNQMVQMSVENHHPKRLPFVLDTMEMLVRENIKSSTYNEDKLRLIKKTITNYSHNILEDNEDYNLDDIFETIIQQVSDFEDDDSNTVKIMTYHGSKGLSIPYVFVCDMALKSAKPSPDDINALYVAMSRAEKKMYIVNSTHKIDRNFGKVKQQIPSIWTKTLNALRG